MPRDFGEADRAKKSKRTRPKDPSFIPPPGLEEAVKAGLDQGCLPCPTAWSIARKFNIQRSSVGDTADRLGLRVSNCQLGCFKVDKNLHTDLAEKTIDEKIIVAVEAYTAEKSLTCAGAFDLAKSIGVRPMELADAANRRHLKIHECQLGCW